MPTSALACTRSAARSRPHARSRSSCPGAVDTTVHVVNKVGARSATIIWTDDGDEGHRVNFTLESVEVCRVAERITTAPIVVPLIGAERVGTAGERKSERKLNDNQRCFMDILRSAALDAPADLKDAIGVPSGVVPIQRGTLKRALVARGWIEETQSDKSRSTVTNMINALAGKGVIGATRTHLWVIS